MMSYPGEGSKGKYISWFWMIFNLGAVIGSLIPLGQNLHSTAGKVNDGTYVGFIVLMFLGAVLAWFMVDSKHVERSDGTHVIVMKQPSWSSEILGLVQCLRTDYYILAFFPMFFASNWFYTYQFNDVNLAKFNVRTRALNNTLYWSAQIVGAYIFGYALDFKGLRRTIRAKIALVALFLLTMAIWGGGYAFQLGYTRESQAADGAAKYDFTTSGYIGPMFLYFFYGFFDAAWQTCVYWFMGALTNNSRKLANFAGFYKGIQSAGAAVVYGLDNAKIPYLNMLASNWALLAGSLVVAAPVILFKVTDHVSVEKDLQFSDETEGEVVGQSRVEMQTETK
jgi:MFS family permease